MRTHVAAIAFVHLMAVAAAPSASAAAKDSNSYCAPRSGVQMVDLASIIDEAFAQKMNEVGVSVVARYYDYENETLRGKRLRMTEIPILRKYGLKLLAIFQHNNNRADTFRNWQTRGPADAAEALKLARTFSQPAGSAIYVGVDGDFVGSGAGDLRDKVRGYFQTIRAAFREAGANYELGVYGSGATCNLLRGESLVKFCWISQSHGFVGTKEILATNRYVIAQHLSGTCGGKSIDFNTFRSGVTDVGQFSVP